MTSSWYIHEKKEFRNNPILYACAKYEMTAEEALSHLAVAYDDLLKTYQRYVEQNAQFVFKVNNNE